MKHIIKVEILENLPNTRPIVAMDINKQFFQESKKKKPVGPPNDEIWYTSVDGKTVAPYKIDSLPEIDTNTYNDGKGVIKFKSDVTNIGNYAFDKCGSLSSVTIPNSVTSIGEYAFYGCTGLTSVTIGNSVTSIGELAFYDCSGLSSVHISDIASWCTISFGSSDANPLHYAHNLYVNEELVTDLVIPNSVTNIGGWAFSGCTGLTSVTIPNSVISIGYAAFSHCSGLTSVTIPNSVTDLGENTFQNCTSLSNVAISNSITSIKNYTFYGCAGLTSIEIPNSVTVIGEFAFYGCTGLTSVVIPDSVIRIRKDAFNNCTGWLSITIPNSVIGIGEAAFNNVLNIVYNGTATGSPWNAKNINGYLEGNLLYSDTTKYTLLKCSSEATGEIIIPNSVRSIYSKAFNGCIGLTSVVIPNSVTSIESNAFEGCTGLNSVTIGNSVTYIGGGAFRNCSSLTSITIPDSVKNIESHALEGCTGLNSVTIGNSVTSIGESAFDKCTSLTTVIVIPNSVTSIGVTAFGQTSAKIVFSKLYSTYTNKIFSMPSTNGESYTYNVEFNISEIPTDYNISSMLPKVDDSGKGTITYHIYTDYTPCKDQALALVTQKTIVKVYHIDGTPWE